MSNTKTRTRALRRFAQSAASALVGFASFTGVANAQTPGPAPAVADEEEERDTIVITGSQIRGVAPVGSNLVNVGREAIEDSAGVTTAAMLQDVPQVFNLGVTESSRTGNGGAGNITFGTSINLRGISPFATLTLLNGRRPVPNGTTGVSVDPSVIPTVALQRVEIVPDGASAIYGSDAIAGVVNLITRRNFVGAEITAQYGGAQDYDDQQISAIWGHGWDSGNIVLSVENAFHSNLPGRARDFFVSDLRAWGGRDNRSTQCAPGNVVIANVFYAIPASGPVTPASLLPNTRNLCDNIKNLDILPEQDRWSGFTAVNQDLGERVRLFGEAYWSRREYVRQTVTAAQNLTVPSTNAFYVRPAGAPAGTSEQVQYWFGADYGPNFEVSGFAQAYHIVTGAEIDLSADWRLETALTFGRSDERNDARRGINTAALTAALASSNPTTAFNPFGTTANNPTVLAAIDNNVSYSPGRSIQQTMDAKLDGPLFSLPGGQVRAAFGGEWMNISLYGGQSQGSRTALSIRSVRSERDIYSVFAEVNLPIVGEANAIPGVQALDLSIAGRYADYSDVGATTNPKIGLNWEPFDALQVHASYGTSFRAPTLSQLNGIATPGIFLQNYSDPLTGGLTQGAAINGSPPSLEPEEATTWSLGFNYSPEALPLRLSVNYFDILYEKQIIGYLSNLNILQNPTAFGSVFQRRPSDPAGSAAFTAMLQALISSGRTINGGSAANVLATNLFVDGRAFNLALTKAGGFDFSLDYTLPAFGGDLDLGLSGTYFTKYQIAQTPTAPVMQGLNKINNPLRLRTRGKAVWSQGGFRAAAYVNFLDGYINDLSTPRQLVDSYLTGDVRLSYDFGDNDIWALSGLRFGLDVTNLSDEQPPFVNIAPNVNGGGGFDPGAANPIGRLVSVSIGKAF